MALFSPAGALAGFGSGFFPGMETGMGLRDKLDMAQGNAALMKALGGIEGLGGLLGPRAPMPGQALPGPQPPPGPPMSLTPGPQQARVPGQGGPFGQQAPPGPQYGEGTLGMTAGTRGELFADAATALRARQRMPAAVASSTGKPQPEGAEQPPSPSRDALPSSPMAQTLRSAVEALQSQQPMTLPQLGALIERANPGLSARAKFHALAQGAQLLNRNGQGQLEQMMRMLQLEQGERRLEQAERREQRLESKEDPDVIAGKAAKRAGVQALIGADKSALSKETQNYTAIGRQEDTLRANFGRLVSIAEQVPGLTNVPTIEGWTRTIAQKLGNEAANNFRMQIELVRAEIGHILFNPLGSALTEGARKEGESFLAGNITVPMLKSLLTNVINPDIKNRRDASIKQQKRLQERIKARMRGEEPPEEEEEPAAPAAPAAPAGAGGGGDPAGWFAK